MKTSAWSFGRRRWGCAGTSTVLLKYECRKTLWIAFSMDRDSALKFCIGLSILKKGEEGHCQRLGTASYHP